MRRRCLRVPVDGFQGMGSVRRTSVASVVSPRTVIVSVPAFPAHTHIEGGNVNVYCVYL